MARRAASAAASASTRRRVRNTSNGDNSLRSRACAAPRRGAFATKAPAPILITILPCNSSALSASRTELRETFRERARSRSAGKRPPALNAPFKGGAQAVTGLLGEQVDAVIDGTAVAQVKAGKLKAIAVTGPRLAALPDVRQRLSDLGLTAQGSTARQLAEHIHDETEKVARIVRQTGIRFE